MDIVRIRKLANNKFSWRDRARAVGMVKHWNCPETREIVTRLALEDPVYSVREKAFKVAHSFGVLVNGRPIFLGKKPKGDLVEHIQEKLVMVRDSFDEKCSAGAFLAKWKQMYPVDFDIYEGDRGNKKLMRWISEEIPKLPKTKK